MKSNRKGFTLIELLVVILIIGILAAIALPQYQQAVMKARLVEMQVLVKALDQANTSYYQEHGTYATNIDDLDIGFKSLTHAPALAQSFGMEDCYVKDNHWGMFINGLGLSGAILFDSGYPYSGFVTWNEAFGFEPGKLYCAEFYAQTGFCEKFYKGDFLKRRNGTEYYYTMH